MTESHFEETITALIGRVPFQLFTVELNTGQRIEIDHARAISYREGVAAFPGPGGTPHIFDHESVSQVIVAPASTNS
jgi:hypothetical protein